MTERVARYVSSPTRIPSTGAASCRREAVLTTSPATTPSPCAALAPTDTSASPVLTATRILSSSSGSLRFSSWTAAHIARAALTARSGSSPCATGAPKIAITASPMNFSTVPPNFSSSERIRAKYGVRIARTSSGSSRSARAVKPTRSAKRTVTTFRSSRSPCDPSESGCPQAEQNFALGGFSWLQLEQIATGKAYGNAGRRLGFRSRFAAPIEHEGRDQGDRRRHSGRNRDPVTTCRTSDLRDCQPVAFRGGQPLYCDDRRLNFLRCVRSGSWKLFQHRARLRIGVGFEGIPVPVWHDDEQAVAVNERELEAEELR